jgi:hypothetical protein
MTASRAPRVSGESQGQVDLGHTGSLALRVSGPGQQSVTTSIS